MWVIGSWLLVIGFVLHRVYSASLNKRKNQLLMTNYQPTNKLLQIKTIMITEEEFLQKAYAQPRQWEYHQGQLTALEAESETHTQICGNLEKLFGVSSVIPLLFMPLADVYAYPDFMLLPDEQIIYEEPQQASAVLNPTLVVEIMSPYSKTTDSQTKWDFYQQIASLEQYLLIDEQRPLLQLFTRNDQGWKLEIIKNAENEKPVLIGGQEVSLSEIYADCG